MKLTRSIKLFALSLLCVVSAIFGVCFLNDGTAETKAYASTATGLTETTMDRVVLSGAGKSEQTVDFVEFTLDTQNAYFLIEYEGQNVPNFAFRAASGLSTWNGESKATAGALMAQTFHNGQYDESGAAKCYGIKLAFSDGLNTASQFSSIVGEAGKGPGLTHMTVGMRYVLIAGLDAAGSYTYKLFTVATDGSVTLINDLTGASSVWGTTATNKKAVIYPNIGVGPEEITFKYAQPASSVESLVRGLGDGVAYKEALLEELGLLFTASLNKVDATTTGVVSGMEYVLFDDYANDSAYFLVDFVGQNVPNFAVKASEALSEWPTCDGTWETVNSKTAGMFISQAWRGASIYGNNWQSQAAVLWHGTTNVAASSIDAANSCGLSDYVEGKHYIMILGYEYVAGNRNDVITQYVFSETGGAITLENSFMLTTTETDSYVGSGTKLAFYSPMNFGTSAISFNYATPQPSLEKLINGLPQKYAYKSQITENLLGQKVTILDEKGVELSSTYSKESSYTLPAYSAAGVIGYDVEGKLYQAGDAVELTKNVTAQEVNLALTLKEGARVRAASNGTQYGGLRFEATVNAAVVEKYGLTIQGQIMPTASIVDTFDVGEQGAATKTLDNFVTEDGVSTYRITLTNILYTNYNREFSALAYTEVTYADGDKATVVSNYDSAKNPRSIYQVAVAALYDTKATYSDSEMTVLKEYVGYTVNLVNENGTVTRATSANDGVSDEDRKYTVAQSGNTVTITLTDIPERLQGASYIPVTIYSGTKKTRDLVAVTIEGTTGTATYTIGA